MPELSAIDRAFDEALLSGLTSNVDGDQSVQWTLPSGFGDCALLEASVVVTSIATIQAAFESSGPSFHLRDAAGVPQDLPFAGRWQLRQAAQVIAWAAPDQVQFWREAESLQTIFPEIDTNAAPTADVNVYVKVRRLRPELSRTEEERGFFLTS